MQKEMQDAGAAGFRYAAVMGGETPIGGKEVVVVMQKTGSDASRYEVPAPCHEQDVNHAEGNAGRG